ncbi:hypothetical protein [Lyticum sinuosum]|uniref:Transmembrane protein n=1 Tax=Lyticum sinuosum TaxID=1332059 RepID=A0AAE4VJF8_9RICK|nr:hypothetical protein [Lyticum sinuosum]MDZ5760911.1 hypothetical protein [Lyticum sinuosum]
MNNNNLEDQFSRDQSSEDQFSQDQSIQNQFRQNQSSIRPQGNIIRTQRNNYRIRPQQDDDSCEEIPIRKENKFISYCKGKYSEIQRNVLYKFLFSSKKTHTYNPLLKVYSDDEFNKDYVNKTSYKQFFRDTIDNYVNIYFNKFKETVTPGGIWDYAKNIGVTHIAVAATLLIGIKGVICCTLIYFSFTFIKNVLDKDNHHVNRENKYKQALKYSTLSTVRISLAVLSTFHSVLIDKCVFISKIVVSAICFDAQNSTDRRISESFDKFNRLGIGMFLSSTQSTQNRQNEI